MCKITKIGNSKVSKNPTILHKKTLPFFMAGLAEY
jgi:hypothetical protein